MWLDQLGLTQTIRERITAWNNKTFMYEINGYQLDSFEEFKHDESWSVPIQVVVKKNVTTSQALEAQLEMEMAVKELDDQLKALDEKPEECKLDDPLVQDKTQEKA